MNEVAIFGVGNIGARVAYFLARSRHVSRIWLVDVDPERSRATLLDFLQSNVALHSKIGFSSYEEPKEIEQSDVVIVAATVEGRADPRVELPTSHDVSVMDEIAAQVGHFATQAMIAVVSQPAELFCHLLVERGFFKPERVIGFPLLIYREWFRDRIANLVGVSNEDVRISTVRTLHGEELVVDQCSVGGVPLSSLVEDLSALSAVPDADVMGKRLANHHYSPAAVIAEVTGELVNRRRQVITCVTRDPDLNAFVEAKAMVGPEHVERIVDLDLDPDQAKRYRAYKDHVASLTRELPKN